MFPPRSQHRAGPRRLASVALVALSVGGAGAASAAAAPTPMVDLGAASTYAVISGASVGNTVNTVGAPHTTLRGDLGVKANAQPTGFPPGVVTGTTRVGTPADPAHANLVAAYSELSNRAGGAVLAGELTGLTIGPGLHASVAAVSNTGTVTLDAGGDPDAVFAFKVNGALTMAAGARVLLTDGAQASRVFWQVNGAGSVGAGGRFSGTLMALNAVAMGAGTLVNGRAFGLNGAVSLDSNEFYSVAPAVAIAGGPSAITTDTTPSISGTTDVESPGKVTVTIGGQTLEATPVDGAWSVTSGLLPNDTYPVSASVVDAAGNPGGATQQLTIDTVLPIVTIDGPETWTTNDSTPTFTGTSDVAPGTMVRLTLPGQVRTTLVQADGTWNVTLSTLADGARTVSVTVEDPAGNDGSDALGLTIDTAAPAATITGGANALTNDPTPGISGSASVPSGSIVTVDLANETLFAQVGDDGAWTTTAAALGDGPHRIVMSVSDPAGNRATSSQMLTVDTVAPAIAITGGPEATTADTGPTLTGTSSATPGTTVTVTIAGQLLTTLLQTDGTWNVTPAAVGEGTWEVLASAPDPAGNVGRARQTLVTGHRPAPATTPPVVTTPPAALSPVRTTIVTSNGSQRVTGRAGTISVAITAPRSGLVRATVTGKIRIKGVKRPISLTTRTATVASGQKRTLKIRPRGTKRTTAAAVRRIRLALGRRRSVVATITVRLVDSARVTRVVTRKVTLRR